MNAYKLKISDRNLFAPIYVVEKNADRIKKALHDVNGRAESFTITDIRRLKNIIEDAEKRLQVDGTPLPKSRRRGIRVLYRPCGPWAKKYGSTAITTIVALEWRAAGWALIGAERDDWLNPQEGEKLHIVLTDDAKNWVLSHVAGYDATSTLSELAA